MTTYQCTTATWNNFCVRGQLYCSCQQPLVSGCSGWPTLYDDFYRFRKTCSDKYFTDIPKPSFD